jgi:hypothetical protein
LWDASANKWGAPSRTTAAEVIGEKEVDGDEDEEEVVVVVEKKEKETAVVDD